MHQQILSDLFEKEKQYLNHFFDHVDLKALNQVLEVLNQCKGMIILTGIGKSGIVAKKIAVTMTSVGTRAVFLSPTNALHGDIGIVNPQDVFVVISKSGESDELLNLIPFVRNRGVKVIAFLSTKESRIGKAVDIPFVLPSEPELCPYDMAPTTSTTIQSIVGDVLAVALMKIKEFSLAEYAKSHPSGRIGKRMFVKVSDLMLKEEAIPVAFPSDKLVDTLVELSNKKCGCVLVIDKEKKLQGIFTDGDLRRALQKQGAKALDAQLQQLMNSSPSFIHPEELAWNALKKMEGDQKHPFMVLPVLDSTQKVIGIIKMHDLVQAGL